jgi:gas vesicle protein
MKSNHTPGYILAFLTGAAVGAVVGILYAPDTGSNTRDKLSYRLGKYYGRLKEMSGRIEAANGQARNGSSNPVQATEYRKAEDLLKEVETLLDDLKSKHS